MTSNTLRDAQKLCILHNLPTCPVSTNPHKYWLSLVSIIITPSFEPDDTSLEKEGHGYVVASLGVDSGYVPYSTKAEETDLDTLTTIVKRYHNQETWKDNLVFEEKSFDLLK